MKLIKKHYFQKYSNPIRAIFFSVCAMLVMSSTSWAATYYADKTAGRDTNPGTQTLPWQNCPGMSGWTGTATLKAGDSVIFDRGDTWSISSGTSFLSVKGGVSYIGDSWGAGTRATFLATGNLGQHGIIFREDHPTYETVFQGFQVNMNNRPLQAMGAVISINWPSYGSMTGATKRIKNCVAHGFPNVASPLLYGIKVGANEGDHTNNIEIIDTEVYNIPITGIHVYPAVNSSASQVNNVTIRGCNVHDVGGQGGNGYTVKNNVDNCVIEYSYSHNNGWRGMEVANTSGIDSPTNVHMRYNIIKGNRYGGIYLMGNTDKSVFIYGNLIFNNLSLGGSPGAGIYGETILGGRNTFRIYNNTLFQNGGGEIHIANSSATFPVLEIKNNIMYSRSDKYPLYCPSGKITAHSNNIFYRPGGSYVVRDGSSDYTAANVTTWESSAFASDPGFKNIVNLPTGFVGAYGADCRPNADGLDISTSSPANDRGVAVVSPYNGSINSVPRATSGKCDPGAYENGGATGVTLAPPLNLRIVN